MKLWASLIQLWVVAFLVAMGLVGCKVDHQVRSQMSRSTLLKPYIRTLSIGSDYRTRSRGSSPVLLTSGQPLDAGYWGWNDTTGYLRNSSLLEIHHNFTKLPLPDLFFQQDYLVSFADGTWPNNDVSTGVIRPLAITGYTYKTYNTSKVDITPTVPDTYTVNYNLVTGLTDSAVWSQYDTAGVLLNKFVYQFVADPRSYSEYYNGGYRLYTGATATLSGSTTTTIQSTLLAGVLLETYTYKNFNAVGAVADFASNTFGVVNGSTIAKKVTTVGQYPTATTTLAANTVQTTTTFYTNDTTSVYETVLANTYGNLTSRVFVSAASASYSIVAGVKTLVAQSLVSYKNGFESSRIDYAVTAGVATANLTTTTTRNQAGRPVKVVAKNVAAGTTVQDDYLYDSTARLLTYRTSNVSATGALSCAAGAYDMVYQTTKDVAGKTAYIVTKTSYPCSGTTLSKTPSTHVTTTYNAAFLALLVQSYSYVGAVSTLASQSSTTYNVVNQKTRLQTYTVTLGVAAKSGYTDYTYDINSFLISTIPYGSTGVPTANYTVNTYLYK